MELLMLDFDLGDRVLVDRRCDAISAHSSYEIAAPFMLSSIEQVRCNRNSWPKMEEYSASWENEKQGLGEIDSTYTNILMVVEKELHSQMRSRWDLWDGLLHSQKLYFSRRCYGPRQGFSIWRWCLGHINFVWVLNQKVACTSNI